MTNLKTPNNMHQPETSPTRDSSIEKLVHSLQTAYPQKRIVQDEQSASSMATKILVDDKEFYIHRNIKQLEAGSPEGLEVAYSVHIEDLLNIPFLKTFLDTTIEKYNIIGFINLKEFSKKTEKLMFIYDRLEQEDFKKIKENSFANHKDILETITQMINNYLHGDIFIGVGKDRSQEGSLSIITNGNLDRILGDTLYIEKELGALGDKKEEIIDKINKTIQEKLEKIDNEEKSKKSEIEQLKKKI